MKKTTFIVACSCLLFVSVGAQAQEKKSGLGRFLEKVNRVLDDTNQTLESANAILGGKEQTSTQNGDTKVVSPTRDLKLEFKDSYVEGYDVVINLQITNTTDKGTGLNWGGGTAWDDLGEAYKFGSSAFTIGGKEVGPAGVEIPSGIPLKAVIRLKNVSTKASLIKLVRIDTYQFQGFEIKNIPIDREEDSEPDKTAAGDSTAVSDQVKVLSPTRSLKLEYKQCYSEGNDNVIVEFMMTNTTSEEIYLNSGGGTVWDDQGESHDIAVITIGGKEVSVLGVTLPAEIPLKGSVLIKGVGSNVEEIKLIKFNTYEFSGFEFRNVRIDRGEQ